MFQLVFKLELAEEWNSISFQLQNNWVRGGDFVYYGFLCRHAGRDGKHANCKSSVGPYGVSHEGNFASELTGMLRQLN